MSFLLSSPWPALLVWSGLYVSDYVLTLSCARLYRTGLDNQIVFDGSYEITPFHQRDVDALRTVSPRFLASLAISIVLLWTIWRLAAAVQPEMFELAVGSLVSAQLVVHIRHLRNLFLFRAMAAGGVRGRMEYSRQVLLTASSVEILTFSAMFAILFAFTGRPFVLGGAFACLALSAQHWFLARKHKSAGPARQAQP